MSNNGTICAKSRMCLEYILLCVMCFVLTPVYNSPVYSLFKYFVHIPLKDLYFYMYNYNKKPGKGCFLYSFKNIYIHRFYFR